MCVCRLRRRVCFNVCFKTTKHQVLTSNHQSFSLLLRPRQKALEELLEGRKQKKQTNLMSTRKGVTGLLRGAQSMVAVNRKTGVLASIQPKVKRENPQPLAPLRVEGLTFEDSLLRIESAVATGAMNVNESVKRDLRRLRSMLEAQESLLLEELRLK